MCSGRISSGRAAVGALARFDDHGAHGVLFKRLEGGGDVGAPGGKLFLAELPSALTCGPSAPRPCPCGLACQRLSGRRTYSSKNGFTRSSMDGAATWSWLLDRRDVAAVARKRRLRVGRIRRWPPGRSSWRDSMSVFGDLVRAGFHHGDVVGRAGDGELEVA